MRAPPALHVAGVIAFGDSAGQCVHMALQTAGEPSLFGCVISGQLFAHSPNLALKQPREIRASLYSSKKSFLPAQFSLNGHIHAIALKFCNLRF